MKAGLKKKSSWRLEKFLRNCRRSADFRGSVEIPRQPKSLLKKMFFSKIFPRWDMYGYVKLPGGL